MSRSCPKLFAHVAIMLLCLALTAALAVAQSTTDGAIGGIVTDESGAVVPNAKVEVRNIGTNATTSVTSDGAGRYRAINLAPGSYEVSITASGFADFKASGLVVEVGRVTSIEAKMRVGGGTTTVEVTSDAQAVNTEQQDFSTNLNQTSINELPINGRRWSNFALLTPGATPDGNFGLISFRGISGLLNNNTIDGGDNNQAFFSEERGRTRLSYTISQNAIREFQVNTSNYSAEYGRAAGGVVNAVTKSGTNNIHGSAFWFIRDNELGATNAFTKQNINGVITPIKPKDRRQQWGGTLGGPIVKDKVFFFFSYDQQSRDFPGVAQAGTPQTFFAPFTASELSTFSARGITPAQQAQGMAFLQSITGVVPRKGDQTLFLQKFDWKINQNHTFSATYNRLRWESPAGVQTQATVTRGIASFGNDGVRVHSVNAKLVSTLSPMITNELRYQWGRDFEFQSAQPPAPGEPTTAPGGFSPQISIGGGGITFGKPNFLDRRAFPDETRNQIADSLAWAHGKHLLKFGFDYNRVNDVLNNLFQEAGAFSFNNRVDFISNFINPTVKRYSSFNQGFGPTAFEFKTTDLNFFIQDDWRIHPRLTINAGLRYESQFNPDPQIPNPLLPESANFPEDRNNFGPRIGMAWDVTGNGKMSVRGGYGIYYGRLINSTISNAITNTGVATGQLQFNLTPSSPGSPLFPNVLAAPPTGVSAARPDVVIFGHEFDLPRIQQYDVIVERELFKNTVVSVSYIGSRGTHLPTFIDRNLPATPGGTATYQVVGGDFDGQTFTVPFFNAARPNTNFGRITNIEDKVTSKYNAVVAQFNRRLTSGLQFQTNYTYAHSSDRGQTSQTFTTGNAVLNPADFSLESGRSNFEIRHRFVGSIVWQPKYFTNGGKLAKGIFSDWTISPIITASSGVPVTGTVSGNTAGCPSGLGGILCASGSNRPPFIERNSFLMPNIYNVDLRVSRRISLGEKGKIELLAEAFNLFNHVNVTDVQSRLFTIAAANAASFAGTTAPSGCTGLDPSKFAGIPVGSRLLCTDTTFLNPTAAGNTNFRERQIQWAIRYEF